MASSTFERPYIFYFILLTSSIAPFVADDIGLADEFLWQRRKSCRPNRAQVRAFLQEVPQSHGHLFKLERQNKHSSKERNNAPVSVKFSSFFCLFGWLFLYLFVFASAFAKCDSYSLSLSLSLSLVIASCDCSLFFSLLSSRALLKNAAKVVHSAMYFISS